MRGRKKKDHALRAVISTRVSEEQKEIINKNKWIKKDIDKMVRDYIDAFTI